MKDLLFRIYSNGDVRVLFADSAEISDLEKLEEYITTWISNKKGLMPRT